MPQAPEPFTYNLRETIANNDREYKKYWIVWKKEPHKNQKE